MNNFEYDYMLNGSLLLVNRFPNLEVFVQFYGDAKVRYRERPLISVRVDHGR